MLWHFLDSLGSSSHVVRSVSKYARNPHWVEYHHRTLFLTEKIGESLEKKMRSLPKSAMSSHMGLMTLLLWAGKTGLRII